MTTDLLLNKVPEGSSAAEGSSTAEGSISNSGSEDFPYFFRTIAENKQYK